jgi:hypothetical protein
LLPIEPAVSASKPLYLRQSLKALTDPEAPAAIALTQTNVTVDGRQIRWEQREGVQSKEEGNISDVKA